MNPNPVKKETSESRFSMVLHPLPPSPSIKMEHISYSPPSENTKTIPDENTKAPKQ